MKKKILYLLILCTLLIIISGEVSPNIQGFPKQNNPENVRFEPYLFQANSGQKADAELGWLTVSENRHKKHSNPVDLAFIRFKSTAKNPGPPIVYLAGGPGGSGISAAKGLRFPLFMALREFGDVIAIDQRGTGISKPSTFCPETPVIPTGHLVTREESLHIITNWARKCNEFMTAKGIDLTGYNTNENADDLESLRRALGVQKIILWGISYGTQLALTALRRHPKSFDRLILAGVEGPDHSEKLPSNIQRDLMKVDELVRQDSNLNKIIPSFIELVEAVLASVEKQPVAATMTDPKTKQEVKVTLGRFDIEMLIKESLGYTFNVKELPAMFYAMSRGDFSQAAHFVTTQRARNRPWAMSYATDCANGISKQRRARIISEKNKTLLGAYGEFPFPEVCEAWKFNDLGNSFRSPIKSNVPVLFISGTLDARTPASNVDEIKSGFKNGIHLVIENAGHDNDLFLSSPEILDVIKAFIKGQSRIKTKIVAPVIQFALPKMNSI